MFSLESIKIASNQTECASIEQRTYLDSFVAENRREYKTRIL